MAFSKNELDSIVRYLRKWGIVPPPEQLTPTTLMETLAAAAAASNGGCYQFTINDGGVARVATVTVEFRTEAVANG